MPPKLTRLSCALALLWIASCSGAAQEPPYDLLITGGTVIDGEGTPPIAADVGVRDGKIVRIGNLRTATARQRIDASGLTVTPGFIDMHNHSDYTILTEPKSESMIRQGVTTMVLGESRSAGPVKPGVNDDPRSRSDRAKVDWTTLGGYFERLERQHMATNIASYVGEEQVWTYVKGYGQSAATPAELDAMKQLVAQAMQEGAMGLSTALLQPPSSLATTGNLIELAKIAKQYGGIYSSHIRDEGEGVFRAIDEAIQVGKGANIPVDIIHMKIAHKKLWGRANEIIAMVQKARDAGFNIQANVYPYTAGQNNLSSIIPPWAHDGGREKMVERLRDPAARRRMRDEVLNGLPNWYNHYLATGDGWGGMLLVSLQHDRNKPFQGKRMSELIQARGGDAAEVLFDVLIEENGSVPTVFFHHSEQDMQLVMKQPWTSIGSDGSAVNKDGPTGQSHPHPRYYGTFPRVLGRYVRELKVLTLPDAVRKMTSMNADKIGIKDRGRLKEGLWADIAVFDADRVIDRATFENPRQYPVGIQYVIVNGAVTIDNDRHTGALAGRVLYGPGLRRQAPRHPAPEISVDGRPARLIENDKLALAIRSTGGAMTQLLLKDDPDKLNPLQGLGHFVCVDGFGGVSKEERAAGLPGHGEAYREPWEMMAAEKKGGTTTVVFRVALPIVQETFQRTIHMVDGEQVIYFDSELRSLLGFDRPINWAEHATIGGPFLEQGKTVTEMSATRSRTRSYAVDPPDKHNLADFKDFTWPMAPTAGGSLIDMRIAPVLTQIVDHTTSLMDPRRRLVFITAFHPAKKALLGYVFRRDEYPWTQIWDSYPGAGRSSYRGLEFATQPFDLPRRDVIQTNSLFDAPTYRWLPAKSAITSSFLMFYTRTPDGFAKVDDVVLESGKLTIEDQAAGTKIVLNASRGL